MGWKEALYKFFIGPPYRKRARTGDVQEAKRGVVTNRSTYFDHIGFDRYDEHGRLAPVLVVPKGPEEWQVESDNGGVMYTVVTGPSGWTCSCRDYARGRQHWKRGVKTCKHIARVIRETGEQPVLNWARKARGSVRWGKAPDWWVDDYVDAIDSGHLTLAAAAADPRGVTARRTQRRCLATGMVQYPDSQTAQTVVESVIKGRPKAYVCIHCGCWHVGDEARRRQEDAWCRYPDIHTPGRHRERSGGMTREKEEGL